MSGRLLLLAVALCACQGGIASPPAPEAPVKPPESTSAFRDGPEIHPPDALRAWLEASGSQVVQLPVVVSLSPLGVSSAHVGAAPGDPPEDALLLKLDDSAMGIGLAERLRPYCAAEVPRCVVWLEGTWGARVAPGPSLGGPAFASPGPSKHPFAVRRVVGPVQGAGAVRARVVED